MFYHFCLEYRLTSSFKRFSEAMDNVFEFDDQCEITNSMENGTSFCQFFFVSYLYK